MARFAVQFNDQTKSLEYKGNDNQWHPCTPNIDKVLSMGGQLTANRGIDCAQWKFGVGAIYNRLNWNIFADALDSQRIVLTISHNDTGQYNTIELSLTGATLNGLPIATVPQ